LGGGEGGVGEKCARRFDEAAGLVGFETLAKKQQQTVACRRQNLPRFAQSRVRNRTPPRRESGCLQMIARQGLASADGERCLVMRDGPLQLLRFEAKTLRVEERMLQAACYIVCAYLTGMRDAEVQAMRAGCLDVQRSKDGLMSATGSRASSTSVVRCAWPSRAMDYH
jgi:integrase